MKSKLARCQVHNKEFIKERKKMAERRVWNDLTALRLMNKKFQSMINFLNLKNSKTLSF